MRISDHLILALRGVFASKFSLLSNTISVFVGLAFFATLVCLAVGVGQFLERYYTRTMSLTTLLVFRNPDAVEAQEFNPDYRRGIRELSGAKQIIYHDIDFADMAITQDRSVTVSLRSAIEEDPEIERLELVAGSNLPALKDPMTPEIVIPLARAQRLSTLPPEELIGLEVAITFARSAALEDDDEMMSLYGKIVGIVNETPGSSVYVHYSVLATMAAWARAVKRPETERPVVPAVSTETASGSEGSDASARSSEKVRDSKPDAKGVEPRPKSTADEGKGTHSDASDGDPSDASDGDSSGGEKKAEEEQPPTVPGSGTSKPLVPRSSDGGVDEDGNPDTKVNSDPAEPRPNGDGESAPPAIEIATAGDSDESIFRYSTPREAWEEIKPQIESDAIVYPHLRIHLPNVDSLEKLREFFRSEGVSTTSALDDVAAIRQLRNYALIVGSSIGLITLISAMCSIFNTLLASVERRTQEIGILRALGASTPSVLAVFLLEGAINAIVGGVVAVVVVYFGTVYANDVIIERLAGNSEFARLVELNPQLFAYPAWLPFLVIGVGLLASLLAALPSAVRACAMQPSNALRHT